MCEDPVKLCDLRRLWEMRNTLKGATAAHPGLEGSWNGLENTYGDWPNKLQIRGNGRTRPVCKQKNQQKYQCNREREGDEKMTGLEADRVTLLGGELLCVGYCLKDT